jgi:hypothetical protein
MGDYRIPRRVRCEEARKKTFSLREKVARSAG